MEKKGFVLFAGLEEVVESRLRVVLCKMQIDMITSMDDFLDRLESFTPETVDLVVCGPRLTDLKPIELAQSLKAQIQNKPLYFVSSEKQRANDIDLLKNGFDQAYFLPFDGLLMSRTLAGLQDEILGFQDSVHVSIPVTDFVPDTPLDFDVMVLFPLNQRYIKISKKGGHIRQSTMKSLSEQGIKEVLINKSDEKKFEQYYTDQKKGASVESQTSRKARLHLAVRKIFHNLVAPGQGSFEEGSALLQNAQKIISQTIDNEAVADVFGSFFKHTGQDHGDHYEQALRVSIYATLFSSALKIGKPEDLAIAGLFHHVGLLYCSEDLIKKDWEAMTPDERLVFAQHPEDGLRLLKEKRIILVPEVQNAIAQHHERPDGKGYPKGLQKHKICGEASLLAIASAFDELTSIQFGKGRLNTKEAFDRIAESGVAPQEIVMQIKRLLENLKENAPENKI